MEKSRLPATFRLAPGTAIEECPGALKIHTPVGVAALPAGGSRLLPAILRALEEEHSVASLSAQFAAPAGVIETLVEMLHRAGALEGPPLIPPGIAECSAHATSPLAVTLEGDCALVKQLEALLLERGLFAAEATTPRLAILLRDSDGDDLPPHGRIPLLHACSAGRTRAIVGPVTQPGRSPCLYCFTKRRSAARAQSEPPEVLRPAALIVFLHAVLHEASLLLTESASSLAPGRWKLLDFSEGSLTDHCALPLPHCPHCGALTPTIESLPGEALPGLVDSESGIFTSLATIPGSDCIDAGRLASGRLGSTAAFQDNWNYAYSGGAGFTEKDARARALGEGLERYCASIVPTGGIILKSAGDLEEPHLPPERFTFYSARQYETAGFPYARPASSTPLRWVWGSSLDDGEALLLPACLVFMPWEPAPPEPLLAPSHSHGLACGASREDALVGGICELIERHAFTLFWMNDASAKRVRIDTPLPARLEALLEETKARGWDVRFYDLRQDLPVPVIFAVARPQAHSRGPAMWVGAGASLDPVKALERSTFELFQNERFLRAHLQGSAAERGEPDLSKVDSFEAHALFYSRRPQLIDRLAFLRSRKAIPLSSIDDLQGGLARLVSLLAQNGFLTYYCDLTTRDVAPSGLSVVRVVIPEMARLHSHHALPFLGHPLIDESRRNPLPHPFP